MALGDNMYMMTRYRSFHFSCPVCKQFSYAQFSTLYDETDQITDFFRFEPDGKAYNLASYKVKYTCCGEPLKSRMVRGTYDKSLKCDKVCYEAKTRECTCECGGLLHGIAYNRERKD